MKNLSNYRTRTIITRGLYTFYPLFEVQKRFSRNIFLKILALCMVGIQDRFLVKSGARTYSKYLIVNLIWGHNHQ